jgi:CubicO group peptidase (beta-lactamase class C family)
MATDAMPSNITDKSWLPSKGQVGFGINLAVRTAPPASPNEAAGVVGEFFWDGWSNTLFFIDPKYKITAVLFNHYYPFGNVPIQKNFRDAVYFSTSEAHMK